MAGVGFVSNKNSENKLSKVEAETLDKLCWKSSKREIKKPSKWEHENVRFSANMDDSSIIFNKGTQEFPQKIEEAGYYKSPFRSRKKIHHYYFVHNPCDVTSVFVDIPSGRNKRTLIYYHQREDLKYEAVYFPYDVKKMNSVIQKMEYGEE